MYKIIFFFLFSILYAQEPTLAKLESIYSNEQQEFSIGNYHFFCRPYGVVTIDELYARKNVARTCKMKIKDFYVKNKEDLYYAQKIFDIGQLYHIEFRKGKCIVYAKGRNTYAELLLSEGLAVRVPHLKDRLFKGIFYKLQKEARYKQKGLWKEEIVKNCLGEIYK